MPAFASKRARSDISYAERLLVPVGWWLLTLVAALSLFVAVLFYLGPWYAIGAGLLVFAVMVPLWIAYGATRVVVTVDRLWVGQASIEWRYLSDVRSLDPIHTRQRRGPAADARAFLMLRPYLDRSVEVTLCDPDDPTPYWLISSRTPNRLANSIRARIAPVLRSAAESRSDAGAVGQHDTVGPGAHREGQAAEAEHRAGDHTGKGHETAGHEDAGPAGESDDGAGQHDGEVAGSDHEDENR